MQLTHTLTDSFKDYSEGQTIVYDDSYKVSIKNLIRNYSPITGNALSSLMESNGYFQRHQLRYVGKPYIPKSTGIYLKVMLPVSGYVYRWPRKGMYTVNTGKFSENWKVSIPGLTDRQIEYVFSFYNCFGSNPSTLAYMSGLTEEKCTEYYEYFKPYLVDGKQVFIRDKKEYKEYVENVLGLAHTGVGVMSTNLNFNNI